MAKKKNSISGRLSKFAEVKNISQLHMLVDFNYLSFGKSFVLEIWYMCYYVKMMLWQEFHGKILKYQFLSSWEAFKVSSTEISLTGIQKQDFDCYSTVE